MKFLVLAAVAATICNSASASAYVFKEAPEPGLEIKIPGWTETDNGKSGPQFSDLGGSWEVVFSGPSKTTLNLEVVRADTNKYADAQTWVKTVLIGDPDHQSSDAFLPWYSGGLSWKYDKIVEAPGKLQSGEPAIVTTYSNLNINGYYPKVAFISFGRGAYWYCIVAFNDQRGHESVDEVVRTILNDTAFVPNK